MKIALSLTCGKPCRVPTINEVKLIGPNEKSIKSNCLFCGTPHETKERCTQSIQYTFHRRLRFRGEMNGWDIYAMRRVPLGV